MTDQTRERERGGLAESGRIPGERTEQRRRLPPENSRVSRRGGQRRARAARRRVMLKDAVQLHRQDRRPPAIRSAAYRLAPAWNQSVVIAYPESAVSEMTRPRRSGRQRPPGQRSAGQGRHQADGRQHTRFRRSGRLRPPSERSAELAGPASRRRPAREHAPSDRDALRPSGVWSHSGSDLTLPVSRADGRGRPIGRRTAAWANVPQPNIPLS